MARTAFVHRIPASAPDDASGLEALIANGAVDPESIVAILGKTEGNGCVNDFTRGFATRALRDALARHIGEAARDVCYVMSGGTEGALSPHWLVFGATEAAVVPVHPRLAIGTAHTADLPPIDLGRPGQVEQVAAGRAQSDGSSRDRIA